PPDKLLPPVTDSTEPMPESITPVKPFDQIEEW
ncbi:integrase, partial [Salmonella enterica]|nr:integrase [Salmonella enterica]